MLLGLWINPFGKIEELQTDRHINDVLENPEKFKLTKSYIINIYSENNEKIGIEGISRNKILLKVIENGWSRIRYNSKPNCFHIETLEFDLGTQNFLYEFVNEMIFRNYSIYEEIYLLTLSDNKLKQFTFKEILDSE